MDWNTEPWVKVSQIARDEAYLTESTAVDLRMLAASVIHLQEVVVELSEVIAKQAEQLIKLQDCSAPSPASNGH